MDIAALAAHIRIHAEPIIEAWERVAASLPQNRDLERTVLHDEIGRVLEKLANLVESYELGPATFDEASAVREHVLQRAEVGVTTATVTAELMALRDVVERSVPASELSETASIALRAASDKIILASLERFSYVRMRLLDTLDAIVRAYPAASVDDTLRSVLDTVLRELDGIDTAAVLLREGERTLRVRATVGHETAVAERMTLAIGQGFAGLIAEERKPRLLRSAATDPLVASNYIRAAEIRALYGVPLLHGRELLGVAHIGSRSTADFSEETKTIFRATMDRIAGVLSQQILQEQLVFEQARYRAVVENSPAVIYSKDTTGRYVTINRRGLAELGMAPEQFIGRTDEEVFSHEIAEGLRAADLRVLETGATIEVEELVRTTERAPRTYLSVKFPIRDARGFAIGIGGVSTDITDRRRSEREQTELLDLEDWFSASLDLDQSTWMRDVARRTGSLLAACCIIDFVEDDGVIQRVAVVHHDPSKTDLAKQLWEYPLDRGRPHLVEAVLQSREPVFLATVSQQYLDTIAQSDEHRRLLRALDPRSMIQVPLMARGRLRGALVFVRDGSGPRFDDEDLRLALEIGRRTSIALDNARLYRAAERAARAREDILGVVAHDLRNPLGSIMLSARLMEQQIAEGVVPETRVIEPLIRAADRMMKLVSDLVDQHAIERDRLSITTDEVSVAELLRETNDHQRRRIEEAGLTLVVDADSSVPPVLADRDRFQQLVGNLVDNARKFSPTGGRIRVGATREDGDVRFFVRDSGPGFSPSSLARVFDRYWRGRDEARAGTGLGLSIAKGIVEAHGGRIWIVNEPGGGATVYFTLPQAGSSHAPSPDIQVIH